MKITIVWLSVLCLLLCSSCGDNPTSPTPPPQQPEKHLPIIIYFKADPEKIHKGESSELSWDTFDATSAKIEPEIGNLGTGTGIKEVSPTVTTTYTLTASNSDGSVTATCTITVY